MNNPAVTTPRWSTTTLRHAAESGDLADAAARLAAEGIPVFPCVARGKQPLTAHGFHDATTDLTQVRAWWRRNPDANIGMPTGVASGVVVVDVDVHSDASGYAAFGRARRRGLVEGWGWLVRTPSGGLHAYYRPGSAEQRSWQSPSTHIDFRGDGGYVVLPPSRIEVATGEQHSYAVVVVAQHRPKPLDARALRSFLEPLRPPSPPAGMPALGSRPDKLAAWVASRPEGGRNAGLFWAACRMAEGGHHLDATLRLLGDAAQAAGLAERETESTIRSAYRKASPMTAVSGPRPSHAIEAIGL